MGHALPRLPVIVAVAVLSLLPRPSAAGTADDLLRDPAGVLAGGLEPFTLAESNWNPDSIRFLLAANDESTQARVSIEIILTARDATIAGAGAQRELHTQWYHVTVQVDPPDALARVGPTIDAALARIRALERTGPRLRSTPSTPPSDAPDQVSHSRLAPVHEEYEVPPTLVTLELTVAAALLLLALLLLPLVFGAAWRALLADLGRPERVALAVIAALVLAANLLAPTHLVTVFHGYGTVVEAASLRPVPKYGAGSTVLYGPLLRLLGADVRVIVATNIALGLASVPLLAAIARRLGGRPLAGVIGLALVGLSAALVSDRLSESTLVPARFWLACAVVALDAWLRRGASGGGKLARAALPASVVVYSALAMSSRPELAPLLALTGAAIVAANGGLRGRAGSAALLVAAVAVLLLPRGLTLLAWLPHAAQRGDLPGAQEAWGALLAQGFVERNALISPWIFSITITGLAALAPLLDPRPLRLARALAAIAVAGVIAVSFADLPAVSIPRVQAPAMEWACVLAAGSIAWLLAERRLFSVAVGGVVLVLALMPRTEAVRFLWAPTNAQEFEAWWRRAAPKVPATSAPRCYVALGMSDQPRDAVFRHTPLYELSPLSPTPGRVLSIGSFLQDGDWLLEGRCEVIYLRGPQCSARERPPLSPPPPVTEQPLCAQVEASFDMEIIDEAVRPNHGSPDFPFWSEQPTLRYGIYRVTGRRAGATAPPPR